MRPLVLLAALSLLLLLALSPGAASPSRPASRVLVEIDAEGEVERGSIAALIDAIDAGEEIRVGWELPMRLPGEPEPRVLAHWVDAGFLTVWQEHVFAQLRPIHAQGPGIQAPDVFFGPDGSTWNAIVGTTGTMRQILGGERSDLRVATRWATAD